MHLSVQAEPRVLGTVRRELAILLTPLGLEPRTASDIQLAVVEACSNVIRHAYGEDSGSLDVEAEAVGGSLVVRIRDTGMGITPNIAPPAHWDGLGLGLGIPLIAALARKMEIETKPGQGTTLHLTFEAGDAESG